MRNPCLLLSSQGCRKCRSIMECPGWGHITLDLQGQEGSHLRAHLQACPILGHPPWACHRGDLTLDHQWVSGSQGLRYSLSSLLFWLSAKKPCGGHEGYQLSWKWLPAKEGKRKEFFSNPSNNAIALTPFLTEATYPHSLMRSWASGCHLITHMFYFSRSSWSHATSWDAWAASLDATPWIQWPPSAPSLQLPAHPSATSSCPTAHGASTGTYAGASPPLGHNRSPACLKKQPPPVGLPFSGFFLGGRQTFQQAASPFSLVMKNMVMSLAALRVHAS